MPVAAQHIQIGIGTVVTLLMGWGNITLSQVNSSIGKMREEQIKTTTEVSNIKTTLDKNDNQYSGLEVRVRVLESEIAVLKLKAGMK